MKRFILFGIMACVLMSCREEVTDIELPFEGAKLVLISYISPQDTVIEAKLFETNPALGLQIDSVDQLITDAEVVLSTGSRSIVLSLDKKADGTAVYQASAEKFKIEVGGTYFIQATTPDGRKVKAFCTVPAGNTTLEAKFDSVNSSSEGYISTPLGPGKDYMMTFRWHDSAGETNYYRVGAEFTYFSKDGGQLREQKINLGGNGELVFVDARLDGSPFFVEEMLFGGFMASMRSVKLVAYLLTTDQHYYEYHRTLNNQPDDNPFAEPITMYSNIEGGYGVFAAYNRMSVLVKTKE